MAKILLDYVFPVTVIEPTAAASTAFLKQACVVCKPKSGQEGNVGNVYACTSMTAVAARTNNIEAQQLFNAGMAKVYILLSNDLDLAMNLDANPSLFYTLLISSDFDDSDLTTGTATPAVKASKKILDMLFTAVTGGTAGNSITIAYVNDGTAGAETVGVSGSAITVHMEAGVSTLAQIYTALNASTPAKALVSFVKDSGDDARTQAAVGATNLALGAAAIASIDGLTKGAFKGVVAFSSSDTGVCGTFAAVENQCAFFRNDTNGAKNMLFAFGSILANGSDWLNQQFITMPLSDGVGVLGDALSLFDARVSFVIDDAEFGNRLAFFGVGGKAIIAPYIIKNLSIDMQSRTLQWISGNQPQYTLKEASLLETRLQEDVVNAFIARNWISDGSVAITLDDDNFVATGAIEVPQPKALWRVVAELRETV